MADANTCDMGVGWVNGGCIRATSEHDLDGCYLVGDITNEVV